MFKIMKGGIIPTVFFLNHFWIIFIKVFGLKTKPGIFSEVSEANC